jgi:hypothetical protein
MPKRYQAWTGAAKGARRVEPLVFWIASRLNWSGHCDKFFDSTGANCRFFERRPLNSFSACHNRMGEEESVKR